MITVHGLKACDTCRKVMKTLAAANLDSKLRDFRAEPPSVEEVSDWAERLGPAILNTRSTTWRGLTEAERARDPVALMLDHPALIKRPVITTPEGVFLGWTPATRAALGLE